MQTTAVPPPRLRPFGGLRVPSAATPVAPAQSRQVHAAAGGAAMRRNFGGVPTPPTSLTCPAEGPRVADPLPLSDGWVLVDPETTRPKKASPEAWSHVFPPDADHIHGLAGQFFLAGHEPDECVRLAIEELERETWQKEPFAARLAALRPVFPDGWDHARRLPSDQMAAALASVLPTARAAWREILSDADPSRAAFRHRRWHARPGCCLLCGRAASPGDPAFQGDQIHQACVRSMPRLGPAYAALVLEECERLASAAAAAPALPAPTADPDDPSTWAEPTAEAA